MTFNTGNPIGSTDARDLSDNAENFDTALGTTAATWVDRFGATRDSFEGRLAKGSFYRVDDFATGYTLTNMRQTLGYNGHEYSWAGTFPKVVAAGATPATSGGIGAGAWVDRTDETLRSELYAEDVTKGSSLVSFFRGAANAVKIFVFTKLSKTIDVEEFGVLAGSTIDQSAAMQSAVDYAGSVGGVLRWHSNTTYYGRIDFSNVTKRFVFDGQGSRFQPYIYSQGEVFYALRSATYPTVSGQYSKLPITFLDTNVSAKTATATSDEDDFGHTHYAVNFICTAAEWYRSEFSYAKIASYYGYYHQYGVFYDCTFSASIYNTASCGLLLDGNTSEEASNENRIYGPKIFSNKNGIKIKGGAKNRIYNPTIQDNRFTGAGGIILDADSSGFGALGTIIRDVYSELNNGTPCISVVNAQNTTIDGVQFISAGEYISSTVCYNLVLRDINAYSTGQILINHPAVNMDTASLTVSGGNVEPTLSIEHNGKSIVSIDQPAIRNKRNENQMHKTAIADLHGTVVNHIVDWCGVKTAVQKGVNTSIFTLTLDTKAENAFRAVTGVIDIYMWDDTDNVSVVGYSGRAQKIAFMIGCTNTGIPQFSYNTIAGVDVGADSALMAPGPIALTNSVSGNSVTIYATWTGSGTAISSMVQQAIGYRVNASGNIGLYIS